MKKSPAFTLIELLIVVSIIGILAVASVSSFRSSQTRARDARRKSDLTQVGKSLELFYNDHNRYPTSSNGRVAGCGASSNSVCAWGSAFVDQYAMSYMAKLPTDPQSGKTYFYRVSTDGSMYQLYAYLEYEGDPALDQDGDGDADTYTVSCGSQNCNFAVTSPNTNGAATLP